MATTNESNGPPPQIIDMCGVFFDTECWESYLRTFADRSPGYLHSFVGSLTNYAGVDAAEYVSALSLDPHTAVDVLLAGPGLNRSLDEHVDELRRSGVRRQVLQAGQGSLAGGDNMNDRCAAMAAAHPDILEAWAGLEIRDPAEAQAELERCVAEYGVKGAAMVHWWGGIEPQDPRCHQLYERASELGVTLWIHTGMNYAANRPMDWCTWRDLDHIAVAHPQLKIIAGHAGWPWILDGVAVLQRHPNVYLEFSAHRPRYMNKAGSGWEALLLYGRSTIRHKIMFGSVEWIHSVSIGQLAREVHDLGIGDQAARAWLHDNAAALLRLDEEATPAVAAAAQQ